MTASKLRMLMTLIEKSSGAYSIQGLARELDVTPAHVEGMLEFWIRKGKINPSTDKTACGSCSAQGDCPFVLEMPRSYELMKNRESLPHAAGQLPCTHC